MLYFFLRSDPSVQPMPDRFFLLPPGRTWGNVPFSVFNFTDEDFGTGFAPSGPEELIVDFEVVFTPIGSKVTTSDLYLMDEKGSVDSRFFRVLPSMPGDPNEVSETSTPYAWIDRASTAHADDVLTTMSTAGNVSAILKPDLPGTYMVTRHRPRFVRNVTAQAVSNVVRLRARARAARGQRDVRGDVLATGRGDEARDGDARHGLVATAAAGRIRDAPRRAFASSTTTTINKRWTRWCQRLRYSTGRPRVDRARRR